MNIHAWHTTTTGPAAAPRPGCESARSPRRRRVAYSAASAAMLALVAAGCTGGGGAGSSGYGAAAPSSTSAHSTAGASSAATVGVSATGLGSVLVDGHGRTLYLFEADTSSHSSCDGGCAGAWPPYLSPAAPTAGPGVNRDLLGTSARAEGDAQVTYRGHPLYYFSGDRSPGDTTGQGQDSFGAAWYVLGPDGLKIDRD